MLMYNDISTLNFRRRFLRIGLGIFRADTFNRNTHLTNPANEIATNLCDADSRLITRTPTDNVVANHGYFVAYPPQLRGCEGLAKTLLHNWARTPWSDLK